MKERRKKGMDGGRCQDNGRGETRVGGQGIQKEVQEGWERCREAESKESLEDIQGGFQKCREVSRSAGIGRPRGWMGCRQKCREVRNSAGEGSPTVGRGAWQDAGAGKKL